MDTQNQIIKVIDVEPKLVLVKDSDRKEHKIDAKCFKGNYPFIGSCYKGKLLNDSDNRLGEFWKVTLKSLASITPFEKIKSKNEEIKLKLNLIYYLNSGCIDLDYYNNFLSELSKLGYNVSNLKLLPSYIIEKTGLSNLFDIINKSSEQNVDQLKVSLKSFFKKKSGESWKIIMKEIKRVYSFDEETNIITENFFHKYITNLTEFSKESSKIKIYIDEAWVSNTNKGLICGLVWDGDSINNKLLPTRNTHNDNTKALENDPKLLLNCNKALPFILSFDENNYTELFTKAIKFILGWLLPQNGNACEVTINAEYYTDITGEYPINTDKTKEFQKLFKELQTKTKHRYQRWIIKKVKWVDKNYEYVPYGDLFGYIGKRNTDISKKYFEYHNLSNVYRVIDFSNDYWNLLNLIDQENFNAKNYLEFIKLNNNNVFTQKLTKNIDNYINNNKDAIKQIIEEAEKCFSNKRVSVKKQEEIVRLINNHITVPNIDKTSDTRSRFTWYSQLIKNANNHGEPIKIYDYLKIYNELKEIVIENDRELVAKSDLNITVALNDFFDFETAYNFAKKNKEDPSFRYLSLFNRAKILSSYAQTLSIKKEYIKADEYYNEAISLMDKSDIETNFKKENYNQILSYKIINAFDGNLNNKEEDFNKLFGKPEEAYFNLKDNKITNSYHIYLLLRIAYFSKSYRIHYKGIQNDDKLDLSPYHPCELIYLYLALLSNSKNLFNLLTKSVSICNQDNQGATMKFIGYTINIVSEMLGAKVLKISNDTIQKYLNEDMTPALTFFNDMIEIKESSKPRDKKIQKILECLPFYYH